MLKYLIVLTVGALLIISCVQVAIVRRVIEAHKSGTPCFSCLPLLLSTTVLNDDGILVYISVYVLTISARV